MADFAAARLKMVDNQLRTSAVSDHRVLAAMGQVARERFVPEDRQALAYADVTHALGGGRFLGAPAPFARLIQLAEIRHSDHILDVGAGTGFGTAVLARLGVEVTGLEPDPGLAAAARRNLAAEGISNARIIEGSLDGGALSQVRYDVIVFEGAIEGEPAGYFRHLGEGGRLVALVGGNGPAVATIFVRSGDEVTARTEFNASLPPLQLAPAADTFVF